MTAARVAPSEMAASENRLKETASSGRLELRIILCETRPTVSCCPAVLISVIFPEICRTATFLLILFEYHISQLDDSNSVKLPEWPVRHPQLARSTCCGWADVTDPWPPLSVPLAVSHLPRLISQQGFSLVPPSSRGMSRASPPQSGHPRLFLPVCIADA